MPSFHAKSKLKVAYTPKVDYLAEKSLIFHQNSGKKHKSESPASTAQFPDLPKRPMMMMMMPGRRPPPEGS